MSIERLKAWGTKDELNGALRTFLDANIGKCVKVTLLSEQGRVSLTAEVTGAESEPVASAEPEEEQTPVAESPRQTLLSVADIVEAQASWMDERHFPLEGKGKQRRDRLVDDARTIRLAAARLSPECSRVLETSK